MPDYYDQMEKLKDMCCDGCALEEFLDEVKRAEMSEEYIHYRWCHGECLLHWAASGGADDVCRYLIENGAYINSQNIYGCNPLFYASSKERISTVRLLLERGADYDCTSTFSGGTPYAPIPDMEDLGIKIEDTPERLEIKKMIKEYMDATEKAIEERKELRSFFRGARNLRDSCERRLLETPYEEFGGKNRAGYWGKRSNVDKIFSCATQFDEGILHNVKKHLTDS